jgi:hypothetical protein
MNLFQGLLPLSTKRDRRGKEALIQLKRDENYLQRSGPGAPLGILFSPVIIIIIIIITR